MSAKVIGSAPGPGSLGWSPFFANQLAAGESHWARVVEEQKRFFFVADPEATFLARQSGKLRHAAATRADLPAVGDFVVVRTRAQEKTATIDRVLTRRSKLSRKTAGGEEEQILCSNVDLALVVHGLDTAANPRRIERFVAMARAGGVTPILVLTKADLEPGGPDLATGPLGAILGPGYTIRSSVRSGEGLPELRERLVAGSTTVLVGASGAGKSALINALAGQDHQAVAEVRAADGKGRHTTTARSLVTLPGGALVIDTPGIRELELWDAEADLSTAFEDIAAIAVACRFRDCRHTEEPDCAVRDAIHRGTLDAGRVGAFTKLQAETRAQRDLQRTRGARR